MLPANNSSPNLPVTAAQQVLTLPDTLDTIFSFLAVRKRTDRSALCKAGLVSHAFYNAATPLLWKNPRHFNTIEKQLLFAFGASISGESLGQYVQQLNIHIFKGCWNMRLLIKIASLTPNVTDLAIYWGDAMDSEEVITNESVASVCQILSTFSILERLDLAKYSYTPPSEGIVIPVDAHVPFTRLQSLSLYRFHWLWEPIQRGLGAKLENLGIGFGTNIQSHQLAEISAKVPCLKSLHLTTLEQEDLLIALTNLPALEHFYLDNFSDFDDTYSSKVIQQLVSMRNLRTIHIVNCIIKGAQLEQLATSSLALEDISLQLEGDDSIPQIIIKFLKAKQKTLRRILTDFYDAYELKPSSDIVNALAGIPNLEHINIEFKQFDSDGPSVASIDALLNNCPNLRLTEDLENLARGNSLFNEKYLPKLKRIEDEDEEELLVDS